MNNNEYMQLQEEIGASIGQIWLGLIIIFYGMEFARYRQSKRLGDTERMSAIRKRMLWGIPGSIALFFVLDFIVDLIMF